MNHPDALNSLSRDCEAPGCDEVATRRVQDRLTVYPPTEMPTVRTRFYCAEHYEQARAAFRTAFFGSDGSKDES